MNLLVNYGITAAQKKALQLVPITPQTYNYTGAPQTVTLNPGIYTFETWGASAPENLTSGALDEGSGRGAYAKGDIEISEPTTFYVYVGEGAFQGVRTTSPTDPASYGFNGGAAGGRFDPSWSTGYAGGGGATDIRLNGGAWDDITGLRSRIIVAGGAAPSRDGGTLSGLLGWAFLPRGGRGGPGTQTSGGAAGVSASGTGPGVGTFGRGGIGFIINSSCPNCNSAYGSGSGYYGGGGGTSASCACGSSTSTASGGSGSSFISGHPGCDAVTSAGSHTGQPNHYSGLVFTNTVMTQGLGEAHSFAGVTSGTRNPAATGHGKVVISGSQYQ